MRFTRFCTLFVAAAFYLSLTACRDENDDTTFIIDPTETTVADNAVALSANETANCYIVKPGTTVAFGTAWEPYNRLTLPVTDHG